MSCYRCGIETAPGIVECAAFPNCKPEGGCHVGYDPGSGDEMLSIVLNIQPDPAVMADPKKREEFFRALNSFMVGVKFGFVVSRLSKFCKPITPQEGDEK